MIQFKEDNSYNHFFRQPFYKTENKAFRSILKLKTEIPSESWGHCVENQAVDGDYEKKMVKLS